MFAGDRMNGAVIGLLSYLTDQELAEFILSFCFRSSHSSSTFCLLMCRYNVIENVPPGVPNVSVPRRKDKVGRIWGVYKTWTLQDRRGITRLSFASPSFYHKIVKIYPFYRPIFVLLYVKYQLTSLSGTSKRGRDGYRESEASTGGTSCHNRDTHKMCDISH